MLQKVLSKNLAASQVDRRPAVVTVQCHSVVRRSLGRPVSHRRHLHSKFCERANLVVSYVAAGERSVELDSQGTLDPKRVLVMNLPWKVGNEDLEEIFSQAGSVVSARVMLDQDGRSRGRAVVEFESDDGATTAINELHEAELDGRVISVVPWYQRERRPRAEAGGYGAPRTFQQRAPTGDREQRPRRSEEGVKLFVNNLSFRTQWMGLKDHFKEAGEVLHAEVVQDRATGRSRGFGFVHMATSEGADAAIRLLNESSLDDRRIFVRHDEGPRPRRMEAEY